MKRIRKKNRKLHNKYTVLIINLLNIYYGEKKGLSKTCKLGLKTKGTVDPTTLDPELE